MLTLSVSSSPSSLPMIMGHLHSSCKFLSALAASTLLYNTVDSPVGVVPVTHVRASDAATTEWTNPHVGAGHGSPVVEKLLYGKPDEHGIGRGGFYDAEKMAGIDRKSTRLNSSHSGESRMPSSA